MTTQEAIKFLQQLYPVGGHCWLDEQRIEAIGMAIKALQVESVNRTPADIKAAKGNTDKCKEQQRQCCLTCVDGDQWAHIEEARTELVKEGNETPFITLCKEDESGVSLQFCIYGRLVSDYRITKPNVRFLNHLLDAYLAKYDTDKYEFEKEEKEPIISSPWKDAQGDDLPEFDREVIALQEIFPEEIDVESLLKVVIAHRPNPNGWDGKSISTGKVEHYTPKTYEGGWNLPNVKYWLDVPIPDERQSFASDKDKKELGKGETKYNLRGIIPARPIPSIKKIVDSLTPEDMEEAKRELEGVTEGTSLRQL